jgi:hypothetical protein
MAPKAQDSGFPMVWGIRDPPDFRLDPGMRRSRDGFV